MPSNEQSTVNNNLSASYEVLDSESALKSNNVASNLTQSVDQEQLHSSSLTAHPSAFRLVKPIAKRPAASKQTEESYSSAEVVYASAPPVATASVVGDDTILPLKYLIPAQPRDSPSDFVDVYSGDEFPNAESFSQWDEGCY